MTRGRGTAYEEEVSEGAQGLKVGEVSEEGV